VITSASNDKIKEIKKLIKSASRRKETGLYIVEGIRMVREIPADAVKKMLLAGEIADLSAAVERLSGYRRMTISEVKNA